MQFMHKIHPQNHPNKNEPVTGKKTLLSWDFNSANIIFLFCVCCPWRIDANSNFTSPGRLK